ncbi:TetR/AcrR family transcriptional regulator [Methanobrevibacter sp. TMH8]|uniref:TetR/AcrR family transcriptional regulator n=1 Tax=Methanobrevibacter sp. TMH8 TaxID=2848611 RepID=UPI001CCA3B5E|nr:TetR/AcrR family transcriptional regulator [Methanobrevibacter sp. TMH8]MBZ9570359.1 TetR/AcrR family transcriptional regulator [Methanobrevibacter sp. TMH8]
MINKKQKIIDVTFALSLKKGFDNVSMKQIQEESGLASGSIYYHFKNKREILEHIINIYIIDGFYELEKYLQNFDGSFIEKIRFIMKYKTNDYGKKESYYPHISVLAEFDYKDYYTFIISTTHHHRETKDKINELNNKLYDLYYKLIQEAIKKNEIREDIEIETLVIYIQSALKGYVYLWIYQSRDSLDKIIDTNLKLIWEAIKPR